MWKVTTYKLDAAFFNKFGADEHGPLAAMHPTVMETSRTWATHVALAATTATRSAGNANGMHPIRNPAEAPGVSSPITNSSPH